MQCQKDLFSRGKEAGVAAGDSPPSAQFMNECLPTLTLHPHTPSWGGRRYIYFLLCIGVEWIGMTSLYFATPRDSKHVVIVRGSNTQGLAFSLCAVCVVHIDNGRQRVCTKCWGARRTAVRGPDDASRNVGVSAAIWEAISAQRKLFSWQKWHFSLRK
jgi:hypothetical protein